MDPTISTEQQQLIDEIELTLNEDQIKGFKECIHGTGSVFCTGEGGTGKSWLLECVVKYFRQFPLPDNKLVAVTAPTGMASFLIKGITLHRFAGVGIEETNISLMISRASRGTSNLYWKNTGILIIDEVSMVSATFFENLSLIAKNIRTDERPFGGIRLLMFGDFLQLPPVSKIDHPTTRIFHTDAWDELGPTVIEMKHIVRQTDPNFKRVLSELRQGICSQYSEDYIKNLDREIEYDDGIGPVRLFARRNTTDAYNQNMLTTLETPSVKYISIDNGDKNSLRQCPAQEVLELKEGCQVILIRNIGQSAVNGSVGTVTGFERQSGSPLRRPIVKLTMPDGSTNTMSIGKVSWETIAPNGNVLASRTQIPLLLAWAITIHKSQGQTIPRLSVDMTGIFETSQAYVGIARCPDPNNLQITNFNKNVVMASESCVEFYRRLNNDIPENELPEYSRNREDEEPPEYPDDDAAQAASLSQESWDNNRVSQDNTSDQRTIGSPTLDTQIMLGHLSLQETSTSSPIDFDSL